MTKKNKYEQFYSNINKIHNFFVNSPGSGILFCASSNSLIIKEVDKIIINRLSLNNFKVSELRIDPQEFDRFYDKLETSLQKNKGIILNSLDEIIITLGDRFFSSLNFLREDIIDLGKPILFWLSEENISTIANKAPDLFLRRDRSVIYFPSDIAVVVDQNDMGLKTLLSPESDRQEKDESSVLLKIAILKNQLKEAESKNYDKERIFKEIVIDLMNEYLNLSGKGEIESLYENYKDLLERDNSSRALLLKVRLYKQKGKIHSDNYEWDKAQKFYSIAEKIAIKINDKARLGPIYNHTGSVYARKGEWDMALKFFYKSEKILIETGDKAGLGSIYNNIGTIYEKKGEWDKALELYFKSEKITIEAEDRAGLGSTYNNIGVIYEKKGELDKALKFYYKSEKIRNEAEDKTGLGYTYNNIGLIYSYKGEFNKALKFHFKSEKIFIETEDKAGLGTTYNNIGFIYDQKGEWDKALEFYFKSEKIFIEIEDKAGLGTTYNNIGFIYDQKGEWDKALEFYFKSEKIRNEVGDRTGLSFTYFNIGTGYINKKDRKTGEPYIILAGFLAHTLGMKHALTRMAWALNPIIEKLGRDKFMKKGEKLAKERGLL